MTTAKNFEIGESSYEVAMASKGSDGKLARFSGSSDSYIYADGNISYNNPDGHFNINYCIDTDYMSITVRINITKYDISEEKYLEIHPISNPNESKTLKFAEEIANIMGWDSKFALKILYGELKALTKKAVCKANY